MIEEAHGNLLEADAEALVNTVNTVGVMGKGIALQFKRAFPENFRSYERACRRREVRLGRMLVHEVGAMGNPSYIINFPTKGHWKSGSKLEDIRSGLRDLRTVIENLGIRSVALPPLGCGNGGLDWAEVYPAIREELSVLDSVRVMVYPPEGAPPPAAMPIRTKRPSMTRSRAALMLAFERYVERSILAGFSDTRQLSIVEAQKVAYFLGVAGWSAELDFVPSHYGPYSQAVDRFISHVEGHFISGYGDGGSGSKAVLELGGEALRQARELLGDDRDHRTALDRLEEIVDGFEFPYGIELLATVHYVAARSEGLARIDDVVGEIKAWSKRKGEIFRREQAALAYDHLVAVSLVQPMVERASSGE